MRKLMKIDPKERDELIELLKIPITREVIESDPTYQELQRTRKKILARYDNDYDKYLDALMAKPREPGVNYGDDNLATKCLNWIFEKLDRIILDEKPAKVKVEKESPQATAIAK